MMMVNNMRCLFLSVVVFDMRSTSHFTPRSFSSFHSPNASTDFH